MRRRARRSCFRPWWPWRMAEDAPIPSAPVGVSLEAAVAGSRGTPGRGLLAHPRPLFFLLATGMWEVTALFGMRTILVFHLTTELHFSAARALAIYGWSSALSFSTSLVGAPIADRMLGL